MLIILEGPDGAGKTTLAEKIVTRLGSRWPHDKTTLIHRGPPRAHPLDEYAVPLLDYRPGQRRHLVIDRWHWGEMVYPSILERPTQMTKEIFAYIEMLIVQRGGLVIPMIPGIRELVRRFDQRGHDDLIGRTQLYVIRQAFVDVERFGVANRGLAFLDASEVIESAQRRELSALQFGRFTTPVTTTPTPQILILGDERGCDGTMCSHWTRHYASGTAFMPYPATSGAYLLSALGPIGAGADIALANACDIDNVRELYEVYGRPQVVSLGARADRALAAHHIKHGAVPHPQFIRRFHHAASAEYGRLILQVAQSGGNELKWRPSKREADNSHTAPSSGMFSTREPVA